MEDREIVELYWTRNEAAIAETEKKYGRYCHFIARRILETDADAEEIVNDTYLKTWDAIPPSRPSALKAFVGKITRRLALDRYDAQRAQKRGGGEMPAVLEELSECLADVEDGREFADRILLRDALNSFLSTLPPATARIFVRRYWYASSITEIARDVGMKESAVAMLLLRTRSKLKNYLTKEGIF